MGFFSGLRKVASAVRQTVHDQSNTTDDAALNSVTTDPERLQLVSKMDNYPTILLDDYISPIDIDEVKNEPGVEFYIGDDGTREYYRKGYEFANTLWTQHFSYLPKLYGQVYSIELLRKANPQILAEVMKFFNSNYSLIKFGNEDINSPMAGNRSFFGSYSEAAQWNEAILDYIKNGLENDNVNLIYVDAWVLQYISIKYDIIGRDANIFYKQLPRNAKMITFAFTQGQIRLAFADRQLLEIAMATGAC